jgi:hypothetical protein
MCVDGCMYTNSALGMSEGDMSNGRGSGIGRGRENGNGRGRECMGIHRLVLSDELGNIRSTLAFERNTTTTGVD